MDSSDVKRWRGKLEMSLGQQSKQHSSWRDTIDLYNCNYFNRIYGGYDPERVDVHFTNWYIDNLVPMTYFRDPFIFVHPKNDKYGDFADTCEKGVNILWRRLNMKYQFQKAIQSGFMTPPGWLKIGYNAKIGQDVEKIEEIKEKSVIDSIKQVLTGKKPKEELEPSEQGILNTYIQEGSIFSTWVPSWNMLMPVGYHQIQNMPWLCEYEDVPLTDFRANPMYKNKKTITPTRELAMKDSGRKVVQSVPYNTLGNESKSYADEYQLIRLYHIWDRRSQRRYIISDNEWHFEGEWPYDCDGFPYVPLLFAESLPQMDESNVYPPNCITPIMPQIIEKSQARTMMVKYRKRAACALLVQKGILTEEEIDNLAENEMMQIIQVGSTAGAVPMPIPILPPDIYNVESLVDQDLQQATSMGSMMFAPQKGTRTATQAQMASQGLQLKSSARVDKVEDATVRVATSMIQLMWQFMDRDEIGELIGEDVTEGMWPDLPSDHKERKRIIREQLNIKIDAGSTAPPKDETVDRKQLLDMASIVKSIAPTRINEGEFVKQLLKKFKFTKELDKVVIANDDEERAAADQENQLMQQGHPQTVSPNQSHDIHIVEHHKIMNSPLVAHHILMHGQLYGMKTQGKIPLIDQQGGVGGQSGVGNNPQQGDRRPPMNSTNPEQVRQSPNQSSAGINQSVQNVGVGSVPPARGGQGI